VFYDKKTTAAVYQVFVIDQCTNILVKNHSLSTKPGKRYLLRQQQ